MTGEEKVYTSVDTIVQERGADGPTSDEEHSYPVEFLRSLSSPGIPAGELCDKQGCPLILMRNLCPSAGLCNGTRMVLLNTRERVLEVRILGGQHDCETAFSPRIDMTPAESSAEFPFILIFSKGGNSQFNSPSP